MSEKILVTGCAGFIGSHITEFLLKNNYNVFGIDNLNNYYDPKIKINNLKILYSYPKFKFKKDDIQTTDIISVFKPNKIIHLASMAGVRNSIKNPKIYCKVNIEGFIHILEEAVKNKVSKVVFASSSSVYGLNKVPFKETDLIETCNSPYASSKMAMELFAKTYTQLYDISVIGLRFFTVYGPRGRPDMAPYKFLKAIKEGKIINKYGDGNSSRDYTYISDIVSGIYASIKIHQINKFEIYNLGNSKPITLNDFIKTCEKITKKKAIINQIENQLGDVPHTYADITKAREHLKYIPKITLKEGLKLFYDSL